ncbi:MAG: hypothetical protein D6791_07110 [Chloroflexi bacterium]|nr:MAG: hypothetical protein D6791_07110 [Chloroflexota bacterium]
MNEITIALVIFVAAYALIVSERLDRTLIALLGGMAMIYFVATYSQEEAFHGIDLNVIFLLAGMMIIANILSETGAFQWLAVRAVQIGRGNPIRIMQLLSLVTAIGSALLDNVTVVVLIAPVTLLVASSLGISPIPLLVAEVLASNIGGAATLIGDPPNILIGSAAGIDFVTFLVNMGPLVVASMLLFIFVLPFLFRRHLDTPEGAEAAAENLDTSGLITDPRLLRQALIVLGLVMIGFLLHGRLHIGTATVALTGATVLMLWTRRDPHHILRDVEWPTLFFFVGLFIMVEGLAWVGALDIAASWLLRASGGNLPLLSMLVLWGSAFASALIDNIPYTATMIPVIKSLGEQGTDTWPLWWALAIGADFGGNATLVGASANVVVANFAGRTGQNISFMRFLRLGLPVTLITLVLGTLYVWLVYLL